MTSHAFEPEAGSSGDLVLVEANFVAALHEAGAAVTAAPDQPAAPKP